MKFMGQSNNEYFLMKNFFEYFYYCGAQWMQCDDNFIIFLYGGFREIENISHFGWLKIFEALIEIYFTEKLMK